MKIKQHISNSLSKDNSDKLVDKKIIHKTNDIKLDIIDYFTNKIDGFVYPAKSYIVAICYACWLCQLAKKYNEKIAIKELLSDQSLLYYNDPYFTVYKSNEDLYNSILNYIATNKIGFESSIVKEIFHYFIKEFGISNEERTYLANNAFLSMQS